MRRYDDSVEVRRGWVEGAVHPGAPEQFLWRGRLWKVRAVLASWVETGSWWTSREVDAVLGADGGVHDLEDLEHRGGGALALRPAPDLLGEREVWRVEAGRGAAGGVTTGVFELCFDHDDGRWALVGCAD